MNLERYSKLRENLIDSGDGIFISKSDPHLWYKLIKRKPDDVIALYHVGLNLDKEARQNLSRYKETKIVYYLFRYKKKRKEALELLGKSWQYGYLPAGKEVIRINSENKMKSTVKKNGNWLMWAGFILLLLICFLLGMFLSILLFASQGDFVKQINQEYYTFMLPYQIIEGRPGYIPDMDYDLKMIHVGRDPTKEQIVNQLVSTVKSMYEQDPETPKKVIAVSSDSEGQSEAGMSLWTGKNGNIDVYLYPQKKTSALLNSNEVNNDYLLWETTTVLRSALYQYIKQNGHMPEDLASLTGPFPHNYLTSLPKEPYQSANSVHTNYSGAGGWVFTPDSADVTQAVRPNLPVSSYERFEPIQLLVYKPVNRLYVISGQNVIRKYPVALGKENKTPEGVFFIAKKIMNSNASPYGSRILELSNPALAIHGTDVPESIGKNVTLGCIRLPDAEMEDLYSIVPLYTKVTITNSQCPNPPTGNPQNSTEKSVPTLVKVEGLYAKDDNPIEMVNILTNNWRG